MICRNLREESLLHALEMILLEINCYDYRVAVKPLEILGFCMHFEAHTLHTIFVSQNSM